MSDSKQSRHPVRVRNVRILRRVASEHGVAAVPDNAARKRVEKLGEDLLAVQLEESDAQAVRQALKDYQATFRTAEVSGEAEEPKRAERSEADENQREWKFSAVRLTYNGSHGGFVATDIGQLQDLFLRFTAFLNGLKLVLHAVGISATMERASVERVHLHAYLHLSKPFRKSGREALAAFVFEGIRPHVEPNRAHGNAFQGAVKFGHFYVFCDKKGSLFNFTDFPPFEAYGVQGWWLDNLLKDGKLERSVYLRYAAKVTVGFQKRLADCRAAERLEHDLAIQAAVDAAAAALQPQLLPMKTFPQVEAFIACHDGQACFCRPILAIVGGTRLGKSLLAADVLRRVGDRLNLPEFVEVTVEASEEMDLADFDWRRHAGVIFDGVGDAFFLKRHRETLQGRPKVVKGAKSATNVYSYKYSLCSRAVVVTFDLSASNLEALLTDHWLSNRDNVQLLWLTEPAYQCPERRSEADEVASSAPPPDRKRRWIGSPARRFSRLNCLVGVPEIQEFLPQHCKLVKLTLARARTKLVPVQRYPPTSQTSLFVFVHSGCSTDLTVDFVAGRGWWKGSPSCHLSASQRQDLAAQIEWAYIRASLDDIVALELEPHKLCTWAERVCGVKYIVEHALFNWVQKQNMEQGVAPSRSQLVDQALASIPTLIPLDLQNHVRRVLASSDRSQRRWLSLFRRRWGARLGAMVFWQWMNFALAAAPEGRPPLVVNMDETSLVRHANGLVGTVVKHRGGNKVGDKAASLAARRSCMTLMAAITHDTAVQPKLPQVLIGNKHQLTAQVLRDAKPLPHNIHVFKEETAWNNHAVMRRYISLLAKALGDMVKQRYVILLLDVHRSHIDKSIFVHARRCGLRLCYVPALMTAELQPCDTHLFSRFKSAFQELWRRQRALAVAGSLTTAEWLLVVGAAIQKVLPATRWRPAFEATGILGQQSRVSASLLRNLSWTHVPTVPAGAPEGAVAAVVFPNGMQVDISSYVLWQPQSARRKRHRDEEALPQPQEPLLRRRRLPPTFQRIPLTLD
eukprot:symbB.v1.2.036816.t1/scaffold5285.1/size28895/3